MGAQRRTWDAQVCTRPSACGQALQWPALALALCPHPRLPPSLAWRAGASQARSAPRTAGHAWPSLHGGARALMRACRRPQGLSVADYERRKEEAADGILERLERHLPGLRAATLFREARRSRPGPRLHHSGVQGGCAHSATCWGMRQLLGGSATMRAAVRCLHTPGAACHVSKVPSPCWRLAQCDEQRLLCRAASAV